MIAGELTATRIYFGEKKLNAAPTLILLLALISIFIVALLSVMSVSYRPFLFGVSIVCLFLQLFSRWEDMCSLVLLNVFLAPDSVLYINAVLFVLTGLWSGHLSYQKTIRSKLFLVFFISAWFSSIVGFALVEFKPVQIILWVLTFAVTQFLCFSKMNIASETRTSLVNFFILLMFAQLLPVFAQIPASIAHNSPDLILKLRAL